MTAKIANTGYETIPLSRVRVHPRNPRKGNVDAILQSIEANDFYGALVVQRSTGYVLAGNHRLQAAKRAGLTELPVIWLDCDDDRALRILLADNRTNDLAGYDDGELAGLLEELATSPAGLMGTGYDAGALEELLAELAPPPSNADAEPQIDKADELRKKWGTETGQLWALGDHRLLCGDSTKVEDVERVMGGGRADICFTSPPYGAGDVAKLRDHYERGAKHRESFYDEHRDDPGSWPMLMGGWFAAVRPVCDCVVCNVQMLADNKVALVEWLHEHRADLVDVIVWDKSHGAPQMQANVLSNAFEFCFVFGGNGSRAIPFANFHGTLSNVVRVDPHGANDFADEHRAVMPADLALWVIGDLCAKARCVVEPFSGSGTTIIACEQLGRKCRAIEISPAYVAVALERWATATGKAPVLVPGGDG